MSPRRQYALALGLLLLGALLVLVAAGRPWASAEVATTTGSTAARTLRVHGSDVSGALPALAVLALAGIAGVVATRGRVRQAVGVLLVLAGAGVVVVTLTSSLGAALDEAARTASGVTSARASDASTTAWRWAALLGGVLVATAGALTVAGGRRWPALGGRYERRVDPALDAWAALDRGIDPTLDVPGTMPPSGTPKSPEEERP